jgi:hypothetical protein
MGTIFGKGNEKIAITCIYINRSEAKLDFNTKRSMN